MFSLANFCYVRQSYKESIGLKSIGVSHLVCTQNSEKAAFYTPLIHTHTYAYQRVINVS